jgi:DNA helicase TIP49 (TBP-interacting protein)
MLELDLPLTQENKDVYEGEVTELTPEDTENAVRV